MSCCSGNNIGCGCTTRCTTCTSAIPSQPPYNRAFAGQDKAPTQNWIQSQSDPKYPFTTNPNWPLNSGSNHSQIKTNDQQKHIFSYYNQQKDAGLLFKTGGPLFKSNHERLLYIQAQYNQAQYLPKKCISSLYEPIVSEPACEPVCITEDVSFTAPLPLSEISGFEEDLLAITGQSITIPPPPVDYPYDYGLFTFFPAICNATSYIQEIISDGTPVTNVQHDLGIYTWIGGGPYGTNALTGFIVYYYLNIDVLNNPIDSFVINASNECSETNIDVVFGCFLEGALVTMSDGSTKPIQDVQVGDKVRGAFGEENTVLALHRPLLGAGTIVDINKEHKTTKHHPHVLADRGFCCVEPNIINSMTYGKKHTIILKDGTKENRVMKGLRADRMKKLEIGNVLQTVNGPKEVSTIDDIKMSPFTQVYHLVIDGSHTFIVDGYAVTGWPNEDDFDYDTWTPKLK